MNRMWTAAMAALLVAASGLAARADVLIRNVTLYDGTGAPAVQGANVLVKGDTIAEVSTAAIAAGRARVIDGTGKYLIPGLWDAHVHVRGGQSGSVMQAGERKPGMDFDAGLKVLHGYLYAGVTAVYDSGNNPDFIYKLRADERAGKIVSPRIFAAGGTISVPGGYGAGPTALKIANWEQGAADLAAKIAREQPDMLKLILDRQGLYANKAVPTMSEDVFKKVVDFAASKNVRTTVHVSVEWDADAAARSGVSAMAHPVLRAVVNDSYIATLAERKIPIATTMTVFANIARVADDPSFFDAPLWKAVLPAEELERQKVEERQRYISSGMSAMFKLMIPYAKENIKRLHDGGVILALGTDRTDGPTVHQELELLAQSGISPFDCIRIATLNGALYLGQEARLGSVEKGKLADLVLLDADPAADVANFQKIAAVIKNGREIDRTRLDLPVNRKK
ncbi:MAG: amidohydrolase family protein [Rhodospirillaceae bacterium]|nr:amidohydrolase family protein [Rhodospirillaceae bacterium]